MPTSFCNDLADAVDDVFTSADRLRITGRNIRPRTVARREIRAQLGLASTSWGPHPVEEALLDVLVRFGTCTDHARAFSTLLTLDQPAPFAVFAAARAHIETSGRVYWHLAADSAAQRVGRYLGDRLASEKRYAQATAEYGDRMSLYPEAVVWEAEASRLGIVIETPPYYSRAVRQAFLQTPLRRTGLPVYQMASGVAHAETWGLLALSKYVETDLVGSSWEQVHFPLQDAHAATLAQHVLAIHRLNVREYLRIFGTDADLVQVWRRKMMLANRVLAPRLKANRQAARQQRDAG